MAFEQGYKQNSDVASTEVEQLSIEVNTVSHGPCSVRTADHQKKLLNSTKIPYNNLNYDVAMLISLLRGPRNATHSARKLSPAVLLPELDPTISHNVPCIAQLFFQ